MPDEIRDLASQLAQSADLGFAPTTLVKGVITASNPTGTPPNVSLTLSGDSTTAIDIVAGMPAPPSSGGAETAIQPPCETMSQAAL